MARRQGGEQADKGDFVALFAHAPRQLEGHEAAEGIAAQQIRPLRLSRFHGGVIFLGHRLHAVMRRIAAIEAPRLNADDRARPGHLAADAEQFHHPAPHAVNEEHRRRPAAGFQDDERGINGPHIVLKRCAERGKGGRLIDEIHGQLAAQRFLELHGHGDGAQRIAAEIEEVILGSAELQSEDVAPNMRDDDFDGISFDPRCAAPRATGFLVETLRQIHGAQRESVEF